MSQQPALFENIVVISNLNPLKKHLHNVKSLGKIAQWQKSIFFVKNIRFHTLKRLKVVTFSSVFCMTASDVPDLICQPDDAFKKHDK